MRWELETDFREFVTARTPALLRYTHRLAGDGDPTGTREIVTDALAETRRHWWRLRREEPEEFVRAAIERRVRRRAYRRPSAPPPGEAGRYSGELAPPADPVTPVLARARAQRRHRLAGAAALVVALGTAGLAAGMALGMDEEQLPPAPPAESGLLPWEPRGDETGDRTFVREATEAWRRHRGPGRPAGAVYVLYAGRPVEGSLALLQARDAAGRPWVAQVTPGDDTPDGGSWRVDKVQRLRSTAVPVIVIDRGPRPTAPDLRAPPGRQRVQVLVAPRLTGVGVSLLSRQAPATSGRPWVYRRFRTDGLSASWLRPTRPETRDEASVLLFSHDNGAGTVVIESSMINEEADLLPVDPPVRLLSGPWVRPSGPGEFTRQAASWYDDGLVARSVLDRDQVTVQPVVTPLPDSPPPRGALVYARSGGTAWLVTVVRMAGEPICGSAQKLGEGPDRGKVPRTVVAGRCVPDPELSGSVLVVAALDDDVASVRITVRATKPGERTYRRELPAVRPSAGGDTLAFGSGVTWPTGRVVAEAYDVDGNERGRWTMPPESARQAGST